MSEDIAYALMYLDACLYVVESDTCATPRFCVVCSRNLLDMETAALAFDLVVAEQHRVTGGPHPRLVGLTDGAAVAAWRGVAW